jgi:hypothetical protein
VDEANPLTIRATFRRLVKSPSQLLLVLAALTGCLSPKPMTIPSPDAFAQLTKSVAEWRELPVPQTLRLETQAAPPANAPAQLVPSEYYSGAPLAHIEWVYKSIGLLANSVNLADALAEYKSILQQISYDRAKGVINVSSDAAGRLGAPYERIDPTAARQLPIAIAVAQALQEQQFAWREKIDTSAFEDHRLALRAVGAGDTLLTAVSRAARPDNRKLSAAQLGIMLQVAAAIEKLAARVPEFLREQITFPYLEGSQFVYWAFAAKGWQGVNGLYANPPTASSQVLHPEKFFIERENPLRFFPAALLRRFNHRPIVEESLGELSIRALLRSEHAAKSAAETAKAWRGDQLFSFQNDALHNIFWFSSWRNETSASEFLEAYRKVLESRQGVRFDTLAQPGLRTLIATQRDGRAWLLQARGPNVLALQAASADRLTELGEEAWQDLEIEAETPAVHFESARRSANFH